MSLYLYSDESNRKPLKSVLLLLLLLRSSSQTTLERFLTTYPPALTFSMVWTLAKSGHFWTFTLSSLSDPNLLIKSTSNALSFYRSQNVLCLAKFFEPAQKNICILCQSQTFCARQKDDLHSVKLVFVPAQKFLKRH